jgi:hypothetical protein
MAAKLNAERVSVFVSRPFQVGAGTQAKTKAKAKKTSKPKKRTKRPKRRAP